MRHAVPGLSPFTPHTAPLYATELVEETGYPLEEHFVTTADGYVLGVYRIPGDRGSAASRSSGGGGTAGARSVSASGGTRRRKGGSSAGSAGSTQRRPPVLLLHGVLDSSAAWVLNEPSQSLGFILADAGFDVWLGEGTPWLETDSCPATDWSLCCEEESVRGQ